MQTEGRAGPGFRVVTVAAHVDPGACEDPGERFLAIGNMRSDELAKGVALTQAGPSTAEQEEWAQK